MEEWTRVEAAMRARAERAGYAHNAILMGFYISEREENEGGK
jgi:hypothetical protein